MNKKLVVAIVLSLGVLSVAAVYFRADLWLTKIKEKFCLQDSDCIAIMAGCGPNDYIAINKNYEDEWYEKRRYEPPRFCPTVYWPRPTVFCNNNLCDIKKP